jgi:hypothetical protein
MLVTTAVCSSKADFPGLEQLDYSAVELIIRSPRSATFNLPAAGLIQQIVIA